jgi:hypothetical protein
MRALFILVAICFSTAAFAQTATPKVGKKAAVRATPQAPMGCKLVGTVRGTKLWAGDCMDASQLRDAAPTGETIPPSPPDAGPIPPGAKE